MRIFGIVESFPTPFSAFSIFCCLLTDCFLGMDLLVFFQLGVYWTSWICRFMLFITFWIFGPLLLLLFFCFPLSLPSLRVSSFMYIGMLDGIPKVSGGSVQFPSLFFRLDNTDLSPNSLILSPNISYLMLSFHKESFLHCTFQLQNFHLVPFLSLLRFFICYYHHADICL